MCCVYICIIEEDRTPSYWQHYITVPICEEIGCLGEILFEIRDIVRIIVNQVEFVKNYEYNTTDTIYAVWFAAYG